MRSAFSTLEILVALALVFIGVMVSISAFRISELYSLKSLDSIRIMNLQSRVQLAIENPKNYSSHKSILKNGGPALPSRIEFNFYRGQTPLVAGAYDPSAQSKTFFSPDLTPCTGITTATSECPYYSVINVQWNGGSLEIVTKVSKERSFSSGAPVWDFSNDNNPFVVPPGFYNDTQVLACPNIAGKTYVGIKSYDLTTGVTECWELKNSSCSNGLYPVGLKIDASALTPTFELDCRAFYSFKCNESYAPRIFFPVDPNLDSDATTSISGACVNLKKKNIGPPRLSHFSSRITAAQSAGNYGLRWVNGRVCPAGYFPEAQSSSSPSFESVLSSGFTVGDGISKSTANCASVKARCSQYFLDAASDPNKDEPSYSCDLCPSANPLPGQAAPKGCPERNFPHSYDSGTPAVTPNCTDPDIVDFNKAALVNTFNCVLKEAEYENGTL